MAALLFTVKILQATATPEIVSALFSVLCTHQWEGLELPYTLINNITKSKIKISFCRLEAVGAQELSGGTASQPTKLTYG